MAEETPAAPATGTLDQNLQRVCGYDSLNGIETNSHGASPRGELLLPGRGKLNDVVEPVAKLRVLQAEGLGLLDELVPRRTT